MHEFISQLNYFLGMHLILFCICQKVRTKMQFQFSSNIQYQETPMSNDQWLYPRSPTVTLDASVCCQTGCTRTTKAYAVIKKVEINLDRVHVPASRNRLKQDYTGSQIYRLKHDYTGSQTQEQTEIELKSLFQWAIFINL